MPSPLSALGAGITAGAERFQAEQAEAPFREERLKQAKLQTQQAQANVDRVPAQKSIDELQVQQMQLQLRQNQGAVLKQQTFDAFRAYQADGSVRHLNSFYAEAKKNPIGANMFKNLVRVDAMERTAETEKMLKAAGVTDLDGFFSDPDLVKSMVVTTESSGKRVLTDMNQVYVGTGFANMQSDEEIARMTKVAQLNKLMQTGQTRENVTSRERMAEAMAKDLGISVWEAYQKVDGVQQRRTSQLERLTETFMDEDPSLSFSEASEKALAMTRSTEDERRAKSRAAADGSDPADSLEEIKAEKARTSNQKDIEATAGIRAKIKDVTGGKPMNAADPAQRKELGYLITDLEAITGRKLTTEDRRVARELRNLTSLGNTAGQTITDAETGPIDYMLKTVKKYVSDEVRGVAATSAYEQFRNVFRNALYGASLTKTETDAFTKAAGSLSQQRGPVLQQLQTQMQSIRNNIQSIYDMNDPDIAEYYLGMGLEDVDRAIEALDERIDMMSGVSNTGVIRATGQAKPKRSLDEIYSGVQ